jgi:hypothetical protein
MTTDHIRYDLLAQEALRGVVRTVLADAAKNGLPGEHHFKITFSTTAPGVRLSERLRGQYPQVMTIILQHQFWDLRVSDETFEVGLSFGGVPERLVVPFTAITAFFDPAVQFGFQFEQLDLAADGEEAGGAEAKGEAKTGLLAGPASDQAKKASSSEPTKEKAEQPDKAAAAEPEPPPRGSTGGGEVVRLDRFRKK